MLDESRRLKGGIHIKGGNNPLDIVPKTCFSTFFYFFWKSKESKFWSLIKIWKYFNCFEFSTPYFPEANRTFRDFLMKMVIKFVGRSDRDWNLGGYYTIFVPIKRLISLRWSKLYFLKFQTIFILRDIRETVFSALDVRQKIPKTLIWTQYCFFEDFSSLLKCFTTIPFWE